MTLVAEGPPKLCPDCGFTRPRSDFYAGRCKKNGRVYIYAHSRCKEHDKARARRWEQNNREKARTYVRKYQVRVREDPELKATAVARKRDWYRQQHNVDPGDYRISRLPAVGTAARMAVEPFACWLETLGPNAVQIGLVVEMEPGQVRQYLRRDRDVLLDVVDRALLAAQTAITLDDLYPLDQGDI